MRRLSVGFVGLVASSFCPTALVTFACSSGSGLPAIVQPTDDATVAPVPEAGPGDDAAAPQDGASSDGRNKSQSDAAADAGVDAGPPPLTKPPFDWVGIIGTGQSLSVGWLSGSVVSDTQPFKNLKLADDGPDPKFPIADDAGTAKWSAVPLTEPLRGSLSGYSTDEYPNNIHGESPASGVANTISATWAARGEKGDYVTAHSVMGWNGQCLSVIDKEGTGRAYPGSLNETRQFAKLAAAASKTYGVSAVVLTHGECDVDNRSYGAGLFQMWSDYDSDIKTITGQTTDVILLASQQSTETGGDDSSAVQLWQAGMAHPGQVICTGPKYQYAYTPDFLHMPAGGYERMGEKYGEVFDIVVNQRKPWAPLQPTGATISGAKIAVTFHVPTPPLDWATALPLSHQASNTAWTNGKGFEVLDGSGAQLTISDASISGETVVLTLSSAPAPGTPLLVRYAITQDGSGTQGGTENGMIGQLRDSDDFMGYDAETLTVGVSAGSDTVTSTTSGAFARRAGWDDVNGSGLGAGTVIALKGSDDSLTLSSPWTGATGQASLAFHHDERNYAVHFSMPVSPAGVFTLWPYFDNVGVADDGADAASFDGWGYSYSTEALAADGVTRGGTVVAGGVTYNWPNEPSGLLDNVEAHGQVLAIGGTSAKTKLGLLGSATNADKTGAQGTLAVQYADGSTQTVTVILSDWTLGGGTTLYPVVGNNVVAATSTYRLSGGTNNAVTTYLYAVSFALTSSQPVTSITLPNDVTNGKMHLFDLQLL